MLHSTNFSISTHVWSNKSFTFLNKNSAFYFLIRISNKIIFTDIIAGASTVFAIRYLYPHFFIRIFALESRCSLCACW